MYNNQRSPFSLNSTYMYIYIYLDSTPPVFFRKGDVFFSNKKTHTQWRLLLKVSEV